MVPQPAKEIYAIPFVTELGQPNVLIEVDRGRAARYGLSTGDVNAIVQAAIGGQSATHQGEIDQALAQLQQARTQLIQIKLQAMTDVDKAYHAYESSQRMPAVYTAETVQKAEESFRIAGFRTKKERPVCSSFVMRSAPTIKPASAPIKLTMTIE